jgi:hypothetical protein
MVKWHSEDAVKRVNTELRHCLVYIGISDPSRLEKSMLGSNFDISIKVGWDIHTGLSCGLVGYWAGDYVCVLCVCVSVCILCGWLCV